MIFFVNLLESVESVGAANLGGSLFMALHLLKYTKKGEEGRPCVTGCGWCGECVCRAVELFNIN